MLGIEGVQEKADRCRSCRDQASFYFMLHKCISYSNRSELKFYSQSEVLLFAKPLQKVFIVKNDMWSWD